MRFGGLTALNAVSLAVGRGEVRAIIGPNGAGKSTLFNCLTGVLRPTGGHIRPNGEDVTRPPPNRLSHNGSARSSHITHILPHPPTPANVPLAGPPPRAALGLPPH